MSGSADDTRPDPTGPDLSGKVAIVSGASRGIGRGLALGLAEAGATVVCSARTTSSRPNDLGLPGTIDETAAAIRAAGGEALAVRCDIGVADDITALVDSTVATYGRLDVLVNNAMAPTRGLFPETTEEMWDESMRINVRSLFLTARAVVGPMREQGAGSIINISSGVSTIQPPNAAVYTATKASVDAITTVLAKELAPKNIRVNAVNPGMIATEGVVSAGLSEGDMRGWIESVTPMGRIGKVEEIASVVVFLASEGASYVTGETLHVTGGLK